MQTACLVMQESPALHGVAKLAGAKNAVLVIMASLILTRGQSVLHNVPHSCDVKQMITLLQLLGAKVDYIACMQTLYVDTTDLEHWQVPHTIMKQMRASILVMGPLLARFGKASIALPGGCSIGQRPVDYHLLNFAKMGVTIEQHDEQIEAHVRQLKAQKLLLEYPSVGATENSMMLAVLTPGITNIINAALEPEVLDLIAVLRKMGADIEIVAPATIVIQGVQELLPIEHAVMYDRLEAGTLLIAAAMTGGSITLPQAPVTALEFLSYKLQEMGHRITESDDGIGITLHATDAPRAISFKTGPYPAFPTDLQAPMMAAQLLADGVSIIEETVFENRLLHVQELQKMGARINVTHNKAVITGGRKLRGTQVMATDIRASTALVLAGLCAQGTTTMYGVHHWQRGYDQLQTKLQLLGASIRYSNDQELFIVHEREQHILL